MKFSYESVVFTKTREMPVEEDAYEVIQEVGLKPFTELIVERQKNELIERLGRFKVGVFIFNVISIIVISFMVTFDLNETFDEVFGVFLLGSLFTLTLFVGVCKTIWSFFMFKFDMNNYYEFHLKLINNSDNYSEYLDEVRDLK